jgi:Core-2/I-Branching enzyme
MSTGPVAVAILSHRDPPLLQRLVDRVLEGNDTVALVHHDPRGEPPWLRRDDRCLVLPDAQPSEWGRMSLALAMVRCIEAAAQQVPDLSWLLLVSGQDYPTLPMSVIEDRLHASGADAMLRHFRVDEDGSADVHPWQAVCRARYLRRTRLPGSRRSVPVPRPHPFHGDTSLFVGDMWMNLGSAAVRHVIAQRRGLHRVESYLRWSSVPDEALVPTLLLNDAGGLVVENNRHRYIAWTEGDPHPAVLTNDDLPDIIADDDAYFARKVDSTISAELLDALDAAAATWRPTAS